MKKKSKGVILNFIGWFLLILGVIRIFQILIWGVPPHIFWFCNNIILLIGVAIIFRNSFWAIAGFSLLFFGQLFWIISILSFYLFGFVFNGSSAYLLYNSQFINLINLLVHFLTLPLGFWVILLLNKKEKFAWVGSLIYSAVLFPFVFSFGEKYNINCFFKPCLDFIPNPFPSLWSFFLIFSYFLIFVIPLNYFINKIINKKKFKKKKR